MECPHLKKNCKINREFIKTMRCQLIHRCNNDSGISTSSGQLTPNNNNLIVNGSNGQPRVWKCSECSSNNTWMCLYCGTVLCGRYASSHALNHFTKHRHTLAINTVDQSVYCYQCDDYVVNETRHVEEIRQELKVEEDSCSETSSSSKSQQETASISSNDSGWEDTPIIGRRLRPRKRTISCENTDGGTHSHKRRSTKKKKVVGLKNLGNTCFMNSVLQSLSNIKEFSCYFNKMPSLEASGKQKLQRVYHSRSFKENAHDANVVEELRKVLHNLSNGGDGSRAISPECLFLVIWKVVPQFRGHRQHDAHEFLRYMLDRLHTELQYVTVDPQTIVNGINVNGSNGEIPCIASVSDSSGKQCNPEPISSSTGNCGNSYNKINRSSIVTNVFGGILQSEVRCLFCGMESKKHDPFLDLSLDIPAKYYKDCGNNEESNNSEEDSEPACDISDCLASFTEIEELAETELYFCSSCKCKQKSTKRFWIRRLPNVLCLHIKRFRWNNFFRTKLDMRIAFPIKSLDMSQYVLNNGIETRRNSLTHNIYDLAAVIVHHGNGSSCGHYTSYAVNNGTWLHFNDHTVKEVHSSAVAECKPYILFYIRRDLVNANNTISSKN